ncbi:MAG TPA: metal ABC transporter permease [Verrucomicrobiae bacterium]
MTILTEPYMLRALLATVFLTPVCAMLGVYATARRMAFFSDTVSHGALAGVAIGIWLGLANVTAPILIVSLLIACGVLWLKENTELLTDTIMALLLSGSVAIGITILSLMHSRPGDIQRYLFGDILAIGWSEVWEALVLVTAICTALLLRLNAISLATVHEELAHVSGVRVRALNYYFVIGMTLTVAITIRLLGIVLVTSLLVIPPAAARNLSRNLRQHIVLSTVIGLAGGLAGIIGTYYLDVPCGPAIVLACIMLFIVSLAWSGLRQKLAIVKL